MRDCSTPDWPLFRIPVLADLTASYERLQHTWLASLPYSSAGWLDRKLWEAAAHLTSLSSIYQCWLTWQQIMRDCSTPVWPLCCIPVLADLTASYERLQHAWLASLLYTSAGWLDSKLWETAARLTSLSAVYQCWLTRQQVMRDCSTPDWPLCCIPVLADLTASYERLQHPWLASLLYTSAGWLDSKLWETAACLTSLSAVYQCWLTKQQVVRVHNTTD